MGRAAAVVAMVLALPVSLVAEDKAGASSARNYADGLGKAWVQRAVEDAVRKLQEPACRQLLADFSDGRSVPLERKLKELGVAPEEYLTKWIWFMEGSQQPQCHDRNIAAFTETGSRVVWVCSSRIVSHHIGQGELVVIHEMLHSLGLGENPPTSQEITHRVAARCGA